MESQEHETPPSLEGVTWLSSSEASKRLGVTTRTLYRLIDEGLLSGDDLGFTLIIGVMFILLAVILVGVVMVAVRNGGDGDDWDDYDEEVWDHTDEFEKEEAIQKDREREEIAKARAESTPRPQPKQQPSTGADPRLEGMDRKTYDYWAQQGYSHQQIVDWWSQNNM